MKKNNILQKGSSMLLLILFLSTSTTVMQAQEVRDAAASKGVKFGSPLFQLYDNDHQQLFREQISVGTVTTYWKFNTHNNEGYYTWDDTDNAVSFGEQNGWELHGHPLVWGSDTFIPDWVKNKYTWFNDYDPGNAPHHPLPFGYNFEKKPAYWGLFEAFNEGNEGGDDLRGELRIKNLWSNTYLHQNGGGNPGGTVSLHEYRQSWYSQRWNIESSDAGTYRLRCSWGSNYLNNTGNYNDAPVNVYGLNNGWWSQQWYIENAYNNLYRLKNRWTGKYLHTGNQYNVSTYNGNPNWWSQLWVFEYISQGNRLDTDQILDLTISPNPATDVLYLNELSENTNYIIYNTSGQVVAEGTGVTIDVHHLAKGSYLLTAFPQDEEYKGVFGRALFVKK